MLSIISASRSLRQSNRVSIGKELPFKIWSYNGSDAEGNGQLLKYSSEIKDFIKASSLDIIQAEVRIYILMKMVRAHVHYHTVFGRA